MVHQWCKNHSFLSVHEYCTIWGFGRGVERIAKARKGFDWSNLNNGSP